MRLLTILCLVLLSVHSYSQEVVTGPFLIIDGITYDQNTNEPVTGIVESFHGNGQLSSRGNFVDGEQDGLWEEFDEDGQLEMRGNYIDGEPVGLFEFFDENGNLTRAGMFRNGVRVE